METMYYIGLDVHKKTTSGPKARWQCQSPKQQTT